MKKFGFFGIQGFMVDLDVYLGGNWMVVTEEELLVLAIYKNLV